MTPSIVLGPGERLRPLGAILGGLGVDLAHLEDWADLGSLAVHGAPVVVVDAGSIPQEDLGFVRRVLVKNAAAQAIAIGEDAGTRVARSLLALPRVRWMGWPPDLEDILAMSAPSRDRGQGPSTQLDSARMESSPSASTQGGSTQAASTHALSPKARRPAAFDADADEIEENDVDPDDVDQDDVDDEIARIQSILEGNADEDEDEEDALDKTSSSRDRSAAPATARDASSANPFEVDDASFSEIAPVRAIAPNPADEPTSSPAASATPSRPAAPSASAAQTSTTPALLPHAHEIAPSWWRAQVADLADAVQRLELGARAVRLDTLDPDAAEQIDALDTEVARLVQFARTLGYVAAPPGRGEQVFDIAEMVQLFVKDLASRAESAPRCLFRAPAHVWVKSDRALLMQVFDALFWVAGACSKGGGLVRAQVKRENSTAEVRLEFPAGPLEGLELERIVEPYGVRRVLPDLGPNALSAARAILSGQGGRAELVRSSASRLEWRIELPAVEAPPNGTTPPNAGVAANKPRRETAPGPKSVEID